MTFQINHLSTSDNYIGDKLRTAFPVRKEPLDVFLFFLLNDRERETHRKRRTGNLLVEINTSVNELGSADRSIWKDFHESLCNLSTKVCPELSHFFTFQYFFLFFLTNFEDNLDYATSVQFYCNSIIEI